MRSSVVRVVHIISSSRSAVTSGFSVKFYIVAMLFVLFDIEVVFLYPWAVVFKDYVVAIGHGIFWWMLSFVGILLVAFGYAWKKRALDWNS